MSDETQEAQEEKKQTVQVQTKGAPGILWMCETGQGGCGAQGFVPGKLTVQRWLNRQMGVITCKCGAKVIFGQMEAPRIIVPGRT